MHVELRGVSKRFGKTIALETLDLSIPPASIISVLGENGAGKSTLLRLLAGMCVPDSGDILFDGNPCDREKIELRKRMLFTPDTPVLFPDKTAAQNIAAFAGAYGVTLEQKEAELARWLADTGAAPLIHRTVGRLSRGQYWKVALACTAAVAPELWLVDEPFASGMDEIGMGSFRRLARHLADQGGTVIYTTQMVRLAADFSDRVCVIRAGRRVVWETSDRIRDVSASGPDGTEKVLRGEVGLGITS